MILILVGLNSNLAGVHLRFYCLDSVGHAAVEVKLRSDDREASRKAESVELHIPIEAAAVDSFVAQVNAMDKEQIGAQANDFAIGGVTRLLAKYRVHAHRPHS